MDRDYVGSRQFQTGLISDDSIDGGGCHTLSDNKSGRVERDQQEGTREKLDQHSHCRILVGWDERNRKSGRNKSCSKDTIHWASRFEARIYHHFVKDGAEEGEGVFWMPALLLATR
jgi:hypothetical protein